MLKQLKRGALRAIELSGAARLLAASDWRRARLLILCYHGVSLDDEHDWNPAYSVTPEHLERRLRALRALRANVLPLGEALDRLARGTLPPRSVALTFDDGNHDFYARALPLLREYDAPATVYLTTFYVEFGRPVFTVFTSYLLWKGRGRGAIDARSVTGADERWDLSTRAGRSRAHAAIVRHAADERFKAEAKDALAERLADALGLDYGGLIRRRLLQLMTLDEVRELPAAGVDVELHTHRHRTPGDRALFLRELDDNRRVIEQATGRRPEHFCYPSGVNSPAFLPWLRAAGVRSATTVFSGLATRASDPLLLPRVVDGPQLSDVEFAAWVSGVAALVPRKPITVAQTDRAGKIVP